MPWVRSEHGRWTMETRHGAREEESRFGAFPDRPMDYDAGRSLVDIARTVCRLPPGRARQGVRPERRDQRVAAFRHRAGRTDDDRHDYHRARRLRADPNRLLPLAGRDL